MANKIKDTDYLAISAQIRAMENQLLTRERMEKLLEARREEDIQKILQECGYPKLDATRPGEMDAALTAVRNDMFSDLQSSAPDPRYIDLFKLKYDYHNVKALLKANALGIENDRILMDIGRVPLADLQAAVLRGEFGGLPSCLADAITEAKEVLSTTCNPQLSDILLDRWYYKDLEIMAEETGSDFLQGYVRMKIDAVNLRALVRTIRMGKNAEFLRDALVDGGNVDVGAILRVAGERGSGLADLYSPTEFREAAEVGASILKEGPMTQFEKLCDDAVTSYLDRAKTIPFGEAPLVAYLAAHEIEFINLRILLLGRMNGLSSDLIRARLRTISM